MSDQRALVGNAADPEQVRKAKSTEKSRDKQAEVDLLNVLDSKSGRSVLWSILEDCGVFESVWRPSAEIHYLAGQQDLGHKLMDRILSADQNKFFQMMKEAKEATNAG